MGVVLLEGGHLCKLKKTNKAERGKYLELRESMKTVSCGDSAFHGKKKIKISQVRLESQTTLYTGSVYSQLFEGEGISLQ